MSLDPPVDRRAVVMLAHPDPEMRERLRLLLRGGGWCVHESPDGPTALQVLSASAPPAIALLGYPLAGVDPLEICRQLRARTRARYTFIVLLTSGTDPTDLGAMLEAGIDDYVALPDQLHTLPTRLSVARRLVGMYDELIAARDALLDRALHDGLTGCLNRVGIYEALAAESAALSRRGGALGVAMFDLDHFKAVNDNWGHAAGDAVLREVVDRTRRHLRPYDHIGRVGGEEFLLLAPDCTGEGLRGLAERLREAIASAPIAYEGCAIPVSCSIGVVSVHDPADAVARLRLADAALYRAKQEGRNRVVEVLDAPPATASMAARPAS